MLSSIPHFPDLDEGLSRYADPEETNRSRTRRLVAKLFRIVRPTLAVQPPGCESIYIALDAIAWVAAMVLVRTEQRDALDFFRLALAQNLARLEVQNSDARAVDLASPLPPKPSQALRRVCRAGEQRQSLQEAVGS